MTLRNRAKRAVLCLGLLAMAAQATAVVDKGVAEELMRKAGLWDQLESIAPQVVGSMSATFAKPDSKITPEEQERIRRIATDTYAPAHLRAIVSAHMAESMNPAIVADLRAWYDTPLGQKTAKLEADNSASNVDPGAKVRRGVEAYKRASERRQSLLQRLVQVSRAAEITASIVIESALGVQQGLASVLPSQPGQSQSELRDTLEKKRPELVQMYSRMMVALFADTYESMSDEEIDAYAAFTASDSGARFNALTMDALRQALIEAARDFGRDLPSAKASANL